MTLFDLTPKESPASLFGRDRELEELTRYVRSHRWVVVLGPRMVGKTSVVKALRERLRLPGAYVNLWGVRSVQGLVEGLLSEFNRSATLRARLRRSLRRVEGFSVGPAGISLTASRAPLKNAWDLLDLLGTEAGECLVVLDEVQELSSTAGRLLKLLANLFNTHPKLCFVFTGSLVGLSRTLLHPAADSPLFGRSPVAITLDPFDRGTAERFLRRGAAEARVRITDTEIAAAVEGPLDGIPGWLTLFGNHLAVRRLPAPQALAEAIREGKKVAASEISHFLEGRDRALYWPALKAIAVGSPWGTIRSYVQRATAAPVNDATVLRIVRSLEASYLARKERETYMLVDPMVRAYVADATRPPRPPG